MPLFLQKQNVEVRITLFPGLLPAFICNDSMKLPQKSGDKEPRVYKPKHTHMLTK